MTVLREANEGDMGRLAEAEALLFSHPFGEATLAPHVTAPWGYAAVAEEEGVLTGYLLGSLIAGEGEVFRIAVLPEYRRRGIGEALLCAFLQRTEVCFLEVRKSNAAARRLYEKAGFTVTGERKNYYADPTEDAVLYKRTNT